jgi:pyruvate dehydrogenase E1 component alpha subunit
MPKTVIKNFKIEYLSVMDEAGHVDEALMPKLTPEQIKKMYEMLILIRVFDQKAFNMQRTGRLGTYIQLKGQESIQVACAAALEDSDFIFPMYRNSGLLIARKQPMHKMMQYWNGDERGNKAPEGVNNFPICIAVGTQMIHAAGCGWALRLQGKKNVAMTFFGDGATSKGDFYEALNFAGVFNANTVFVCENNQFAISVPRAKQTHAETIAQKGVAAGVESIQVDGMDIFAMYKAAKDAVDKARSGHGPTLIEAYTYRLCDHSTSDDASRYRPKEEVEMWQKRDGVERLEKYMMKKGMLDEKSKQAILENAQKAVEQAVEEFEKIPNPDPKDMFTYVFAEMSEEQAEQMKELGY